MNTNTEQTRTEALDQIDRALGVAKAAEQDLKFAVVRAALAGASWAKIAAMLEVSKQTAYNRYKDAVGVYEAMEAGETNEYSTPERNAEMLGSLYNPQPHTQHNQDRRWDWTRPDTTSPKNGRYDCGCGWSVIWPANDPAEVEGAYDDIAEHNDMHDREDDTADDFGTEPIFSDTLTEQEAADLESQRLAAYTKTPDYLQQVTYQRSKELKTP